MARRDPYSRVQRLRLLRPLFRQQVEDKDFFDWPPAGYADKAVAFGAQGLEAQGGLLTRNALVRRLKPVLAGERAFFLGIMDIDDFRGINDTFGHSAGDVVLRRMGAVLQEQLGDADMASRIGGDEFVFVMPGIVGKESAESLLPRICAASFTHEDVPCPISVSIGFAAFPNDGAAFEVLHKEAGKALYHAKRQGKRQCAFYGELPEPCPRALNGMIV